MVADPATTGLPDAPHGGAPERVRRTVGRLDMSAGVGLEIGPLCSPMVDRADGDVRYVDVDTTERLREHYAAHPGVPVESIVDVDIPLTAEGRVRSISEAFGGTGPRVRWVVASHVVEHVPDMIGWFADLADVLEDGGLVALAVPDRRYSFDACRPATTVGQLLESHDRAESRPSTRAVFDHHADAVHVAPGAAWRGVEEGGLRQEDVKRVHDLDYVLTQVQAAAQGAYVDCHVWLFSPREFIAQLAVLAELDLLDFVVDHVVSTPVDELEFYVTLRRLPRDLPDGERSQRLATGFAPPVDNVRAVPEPPASIPEPSPVAAEPDLPGTTSQVLSDAEWTMIRMKRAVGNRVRRRSRRH